MADSTRAIPGVWTSTPIRSISGCAIAIVTVVSPPPIPISSTFVWCSPNSWSRSRTGPVSSSSQSGASRSYAARRDGDKARRRGLNVRVGGRAGGRSAISSLRPAELLHQVLAGADGRVLRGVLVVGARGEAFDDGVPVGIVEEGDRVTIAVAARLARWHDDAVHGAHPPVVGPTRQGVAHVDHIGA